MKIETELLGTHAKLVLRGEFETEASEAFLTAVEAAIPQAGHRVLVVLRYVKFLNSTALGAMVRARKMCQENGGELAILRPSAFCREMMVSMGLDSILSIFDDESAAVEFVQGRGAAPAATGGGAAGESIEDLVAMFSFEDERSELFAGKSHHGVGHVHSVTATGIEFHWDPSAHGSDHATAAAMFAVGSAVHLKLQIKMIRKGYFQADAQVDSLTVATDGSVQVAATWTNIAADEQVAIGRYTDDLLYLREQTQQSL